MIKKIIVYIIIIFLISGCGCSKQNEKNNIEIPKNIEKIKIEFPMQSVDSIEISPSKNEIAKVKVGKDFQIISWITPSNAANNEIIWVAKNSNIVKIDNDGNVETLKKGKTDIYAYSKDNYKIKSNTITVEVIE